MTFVIIPTYNERENIEGIIHAIFNQEKDFHILVVDDNSPDGTGEIVKTLIKKHPNLFLKKVSSKELLHISSGIFRQVFLLTAHYCVYVAVA